MLRDGVRWRRALAWCGWIAVLVTGWAALRGGSAARTWDAWFDLREVPEFRLWLDPEQQAALERHPRRYVRAEFEHEGTRLVVGLRLKGHRSMRSLADKAAFKIAFDRFDEQQTFLGTRRMTLNNMVEDPTLLRERLGHLVFRQAGLQSPRTGYASVSVNGVGYGVYLMLEAIDDQLARLGEAHAASVVYEGEYGCDVFPEDVPGFERDHGRDPGRAALRALTDTAAGGGPELFDPVSGPLDMPALLDYLAVSAVVGDFDGYRHSHNYRLHFRPDTGKWQLSPWGLDRTFQRRLGVFDSQGALAQRCFGDRSCRAEYVRAVRRASERFEALRLTDTARAVARRIDPYLTQASRDDREEIARARRALERFIQRRPAAIRAQVECIDSAGNEVDRDGDGHGCMDCNDADPAVNPDAAERCDGIDNDCSGVADDAAACECARQELSGREYHLCNWPRPWRDAERACAERGLTLARIESKADSRALYAAARRISKLAWWIGLSDLGVEGDFRWTDGEPGSFAYWDKGQPNNQGCNEDCVALRDGRRGKWQDMPCHQHRPFICAGSATGEAGAARSSETDAR